MNPQKLHTAFVFGVIGFIAALLALWIMSCALHHPPPCSPGTYPEPCAYSITETISDASREH